MQYKKYSVLTMLAHICTDINQGALPALLPFLVLYKDISYASAAGLIFAANSMSSFIQPFFGYLGDKVSRPWLMGLGAFLAGCGVSLIGFLDNYWAIFAAVTISGAGIAIFHPEGGRIANLAAGKNKGAGIALFSVGGNIGFALGPIIASVAVKFFGLKGTVVFLAPSLAMALTIFVLRRRLDALVSEVGRAKAAEKNAMGEDDWGSFFKVSACVTCRSIVTYGLTTFIPLYFAAVLMLSETAASTTLTLYSVSAAIATLAGGRVADRFGFARVMQTGYTLLVPLVLVFPLISNSYLAILLLIPMAVALCVPHSGSIALGQQFLPNHIGTSSGIMLGLAVSIGGMVTPGIGWLGDKYGLPTAMYAVGAFAVLTMILAWRIPNRSKNRKGSGAASS